LADIAPQVRKSAHRMPLVKSPGFLRHGERMHAGVRRLIDRFIDVEAARLHQLERVPDEQLSEASELPFALLEFLAEAGRGSLFDCHLELFFPPQDAYEALGADRDDLASEVGPRGVLLLDDLVCFGSDCGDGFYAFRKSHLPRHSTVLYLEQASAEVEDTGLRFEEWLQQQLERAAEAIDRCVPRRP
jgi:hypothetical protein